MISVLKIFNIIVVIMNLGLIICIYEFNIVILIVFILDVVIVYNFVLDNFGIIFFIVKYIFGCLNIVVEIVK